MEKGNEIKDFFNVVHFVKSIHLWRQHSIYKKPITKRKECYLIIPNRGRMLTVIKKGILTKEKKKLQISWMYLFETIKFVISQLQRRGKRKKNTLKEMTIQTNIVENQEKSK